MFFSKKQVTNVIFVLDTSGSMYSIGSETIGMINNQIETLQREKKTMGDVRASLVLFGLNEDPSVSVVYQGVDIDAAPLLTEESYRPQGITPMRDGIGAALSLGEVLDSGDKNDAVLVITITDGQENASKEWEPVALADKIKQLREGGRWTFQVLGANIKFDDVKDFGVEKVEFTGYQATGQGMLMNSQNLAGALTGYSACRSMGVTQTKGLDIEGNNGLPKLSGDDSDEQC